MVQVERIKPKVQCSIGVNKKEANQVVFFFFSLETCLIILELKIETNTKLFASLDGLYHYQTNEQRTKQDNKKKKDNLSLACTTNWLPFIYRYINISEKS